MFDGLAGAADLDWTLIGPRGTVVDRRGFGASDSSGGAPLLSLAAGSYRLVVRGSGDARGGFAFRLLDIAAAAPVVAGDRKSTRLNPVTNAHLVCRLLPEKKNNNKSTHQHNTS